MNIFNHFKLLMVSYFLYTFLKLAHNVTGNWWLGQIKGLCEANVPCPNCGGDKNPQRAKPDWVFS